MGLSNNFAIADADDWLAARSVASSHKLTRSKKIINGLIKSRADVLEAARISLKDGAVLSEISKAKARGESPHGMALRAAQQTATSSTDTLGVIADVRLGLSTRVLISAVHGIRSRATRSQLARF